MIDEVRELVRHSGMTYDDIASETGLGRSWLDKFMQGRFKDYGIRKVLLLREFVLQRSKPQQAA